MTVADSLRRAARGLMAPRQLRKVARDRFGYPDLRPGQLEAMRAVLSGRDAFVVMPTGGGKSAVYQIPGALLPGPVIVVSPLLALQQDQMAGLTERDPSLGPVRISSAESATERREALEALREGTAKFLFVTPEQLADPERLKEIKATKPVLVAVDEAHCISAWGHDFRPDYLQLGRVVRELGRPPVVALTATASPPVREDIIDRLGLTDPYLSVFGLDRPELFLEAVQCTTDEQRWQRLLMRLKESTPPGIVYAATRRSTEELAERLTKEGFGAIAYHGGMSAGERERRHEAFLADEAPIMVATTAFGMGIDKPNIRWVNHVTLPDSPDSYLQEIGRAGRDGEPAQALLLFRTEDTGLRKFFSGGGLDEEEVLKLATVVSLAPHPVSAAQLRTETGFGPRKTAQMVSLLEQVGAVVHRSGGKLAAPRYAPSPEEAAREACAQAERFQTVQRSRIDMMRYLAETTNCRGQALLAYFGEHLEHRCGHCDNCADGSVEAIAPTSAEPYPVHSTVRHAEWGDGMVLQYEGERMTVLFDDVGYKTLSVPVVVEQGLLSDV
ncbi:RecQ family ATP-dependent DNA helicase [Virgisporangium aliadipatigenens]|nr:ATP-dependent DNA helicase RecQ [Virgisporangium aliadipatigenens]